MPRRARDRDPAREARVRELLRDALGDWGARSDLARALDVSAVFVRKMVRDGHVPSEYVLGVADYTGISPGVLRPDLYPPDRLVIRDAPRSPSPAASTATRQA